MKIKNLALAVAASLCASQALALNVADSLNATLKLNVSGATAADFQFANYIAQICQPGTLDTFRNPADTARAFSCAIAVDGITGVAAGTTALIRKESGGSGTGVSPVYNRASNIRGIDLSTCTDANADRTWECSNTVINVDAEVGISDVEPELFSIPANHIPNFVPFNPSDATIRVNSVNTQTFGIVVTEDLRNALQSAQGLTVGSNDVEDMPSLSSALVANIFAGRVANWSTLVDSTGTGINATAIRTKGNGVEVCVRANGSGTQAQFNAFYMRNACAFRGASTFEFLGFNTAADGNGVLNDTVRRQVGPALAPPPYIHHQVGSSDIGKCMTAIHATTNRTAIGVQSVEKVKESLTDRDKFKFVAIDGVAPTLENVVSGDYKNVAPLSIQFPIAGNRALTGDKLLAAEELVRTAKAASAVATFNASLKSGAPSFSSILDSADATGFADVGTLAFGGAPNPNAGAFDAAVPLIAFDQVVSSAPSTCAVPRLGANQKVDISNKN